MSTSAMPLAKMTTWELDPVHSTAQFQVKHMMISNVRGHFSGLKGTLHLDGQDISKSRAEVAIETDSITTGDLQRDAHLKSADFFDAAKYPSLTFKSAEVRKTGDRRLAVSGELTIHGVTRKVVLDVDGPTAPVKDPWGNTRIGVSASTRINRKDFGLTWNAVLEAGGILVAEDVAISLDLEFIAKAELA